MDGKGRTFILGVSATKIPRITLSRILLWSLSDSCLDNSFTIRSKFN